MKHLYYLILLLLFIAPGLIFAQETHEDLVFTTADTTYHLSEEDIHLGERLYYGLIREQAGQQSCISCHTIQPTDTFNWNPSAYEVAAFAEEKSFEEFYSVIMNPAGAKMTEVHAGYDQLTELQLVQMNSYLTTFYEAGGAPDKAVITNWIYVIGLLIVLIVAVLDLMVFKAIKYRFIHGLLILTSFLLLTKFTAHQAIALGRQHNYQPAQPIKFSHQVHAGNNKIECQYCHFSTEFGKSAGLMSPSNCLNCHMIVREGSRSGTFEIDKIFYALDSVQMPVEWVRVHNVPDHVYFNHAQHIGVGKLECEECHGPVEEMHEIYQYEDLSMGWCLDCHRTRAVKFADNEYYPETFPEFENLLSTGQMDSVLVEDIGGANCMKCHY